MAGSNERGRAFELIVRRTLLNYVVKKRLPTEEAEHSKAREKIETKYFNALDEETQFSFVHGAWAFAKWADEQSWFDNATKMTLDRVPDNKAKERDPTDIRLEITYSDGRQETKNISLKHNHNALCHPRLPSLAQQCGFEKGSKIDKEYRKSYKQIWEKFYAKVKALNEDIETTTELNKKHQKFITKNFYVPMQKNAIHFLGTYANSAKNSAEFFKYLTGNKEYFVVKNELKFIEVKSFSNLTVPSTFKITYPLDGKETTFLIEFDNGWQIAMRLHTASSRLTKSNGTINMTEKEDPICINLKDNVKTEKILK